IGSLADLREEQKNHADRNRGGSNGKNPREKQNADEGDRERDHLIPSHFFAQDRPGEEDRDQRLGREQDRGVHRLSGFESDELHDRGKNEGSDPENGELQADEGILRNEKIVPPSPTEESDLDQNEKKVSDKSAEVAKPGDLDAAETL